MLQAPLARPNFFQLANLAATEGQVFKAFFEQLQIQTVYFITLKEAAGEQTALLLADSRVNEKFFLPVFTTEELAKKMIEQHNLEDLYIVSSKLGSSLLEILSKLGDPLDIEFFYSETDSPILIDSELIKESQGSAKRNTIPLGLDDISCPKLNRSTLASLKTLIQQYPQIQAACLIERENSEGNSIDLVVISDSTAFSNVLLNAFDRIIIDSGLEHNSVYLAILPPIQNQDYLRIETMGCAILDYTG